MSIALILLHRRDSSSSTSFRTAAALVPLFGFPLNAESNNKNLCHSSLTRLNAALSASVVYSDSVIGLP